MVSIKCNVLRHDIIYATNVTIALQSLVLRLVYVTDGYRQSNFEQEILFSVTYIFIYMCQFYHKEVQYIINMRKKFKNMVTRLRKIF